MKTLELLDKITPENEKRSRVERIRDMYQDNNFTLKQKRAIELFIFEPTKEQAYEALKITPKAWHFIKYLISEDEIVEMVSKLIVDDEVNRTYIRGIIFNKSLEELLAKLLISSCNGKLNRYIKQYELEKKLKK